MYVDDVHRYIRRFVSGVVKREWTEYWGNTLIIALARKEAYDDGVRQFTDKQNRPLMK